MIRWALLPLTLVASVAARADSPITSCDLQTGYDDLSIVKGVVRSRPGPSEIQFLIGDHPLDQKVAVANAIGWNVDAKSGAAQALVTALAARRQVPRDDLALRDLTPDDRAVLAYLLALEDYFDLRALGVGNDLRQATPKKLLESAAKAKPQDFAIAYLAGLVDAQARMSKESQWCAIYTGMARVLERFPADRRNLRPAAVAQCQDYVDGYREYCPQLKPPPEHAEELDQVYTLALDGKSLFAGTQGGAVVIDTSSGMRRAVAPDFICADVAVVGDRAFFGCRKGLWVYYQGAFQKLKSRKDRGESGFELLRDPAGNLLVIDGRTALRWDGSKLVSGGAAPAPGAYDRLYRRKDGVLWSIEFLRAVRAGSQELPVKGAFPGRDPRQLVEDASGELWVLDFEDGAFHYDDEARTFTGAGVSNQASGVAVDARTGARVFLHYREGLTFTQSGQTRQVLLPGLEYMRDMLLAPDGTVWVAGWHGIAAVSPSGAVRTLSLRDAEGSAGKPRRD